MLARITRGTSGISNYLQTGKRRDYDMSRNERDNVTTIYGNMDVFAATEKFLYKNKNYKDNYMHITLSFSDEDSVKISTMTSVDQANFFRNITDDYLNHHTSGYDKYHEVIAYAERHKPKLLYNKDGNKRFDHIHLAIALYNPLSDTVLKTPFSKSTFIDEVLQKHVNDKYDLTDPASKPRKNHVKINTKISITRKAIAMLLKDQTERKEIGSILKNNGFNWREVKTKNNHYIKIINDKGKDINLRGKGFENIQKAISNPNEKTTLAQPKDNKSNAEILSEFYAKRIEEITCIRSKKATEKLAAAQEEIRLQNKDIELQTRYYLKQNLNIIKIKITQQTKYKSYQNKLYAETIKDALNFDLTGYFISSNQDGNLTIKKPISKVNIEIKKDSIELKTTQQNLNKSVEIALQCAISKGWDIDDLALTGSDNFINESKRQIVEIQQADAILQNEAIQKANIEEIQNQNNTKIAEANHFESPGKKSSPGMGM